MTSDSVSVGLATSPEERAAAYAVRVTVFVEEQGVPADLELDDLDDEADHFVARAGREVVGAGRMVVSGTTGVLGRLAVMPAWRGKGVGRALVSAIEERARQRRLERLELHAQTPALRFYERLGYAARGDVFEEAGMPHVAMVKPLVAPSSDVTPDAATGDRASPDPSH